MLCCRLTAHEVLAQLEEDADFWEANVYITPPDNGNATDEDSADEEGGTVNNLCGKQLDAVAVATVKIGGQRVLVDGDNENHLVNNGTEPEKQVSCDINQSMESSKMSAGKKRKCKAVNSKPSKKIATASQANQSTDAVQQSSAVLNRWSSRSLEYGKKWIFNPQKPLEIPQNGTVHFRNSSRKIGVHLVYSNYCLIVKLQR